jgi:GT2 family glycosyltransferase
LSVEDPSNVLADVLIVNYKSYDELGRCLESLEPERSRLEQVLVVDHESDVAAAASLIRRFPWVELIERSTNEGFATGINLGARLGRAPFLLLLNPDCVVTPSTCDRLLRFLTPRVDVAIAGPRILNADGSVQGSARRFPGLTTVIAGRSSWLTRRFPRNPLSRLNLPGLDAGEQPLDVDWVSGACMLVRRSAFEQAGGMDECFFLYWEDADFCRRLSQLGWRTTYFPGATVVHAGGKSSIHAYQESLVAFHTSAFLLFRKHARWPLRVLTPLVYLTLQLRLRALLSLRRLRKNGSDQKPAD